MGLINTRWVIFENMRCRDRSMRYVVWGECEREFGCARNLLRLEMACICLVEFLVVSYNGTVLVY